MAVLLSSDACIPSSVRRASVAGNVELGECMCDWRTESTKRDGSALYSPARHAGTAPGIPAGMCFSKARWTKKEGIGHGQDVNKHSADPYYTHHCIPISSPALSLLSLPLVALFIQP